VFEKKGGFVRAREELKVKLGKEEEEEESNLSTCSHALNLEEKRGDRVIQEGGFGGVIGDSDTVVIDSLEERLVLASGDAGENDMLPQVGENKLLLVEETMVLQGLVDPQDELMIPPPG